MAIFGRAILMDLPGILLLQQVTYLYQTNYAATEQLQHYCLTQLGARLTLNSSFWVGLNELKVGANIREKFAPTFFFWYVNFPLFAATNSVAVTYRLISNNCWLERIMLFSDFSRYLRERKIKLGYCPLEASSLRR